MAALYLSTEVTTVVAEYYRGMSKPGTLVPYGIEATGIVDLTDGKGEPRDDRVGDAMRAAWDQIAKRDGEVPPSWALAQETIAGGAEGALVPSAQNKGGTNLVLWRWHDAGGEGEGASLALLDPERALPAR